MLLLVVPLALALGTLAFHSSGGREQPPLDVPAGGDGSRDSVYLFSYFTGNGEDGLHLAYSNDGMQWTKLRGGRSFLAPQVGGGLMRDPSITRGADGLFHMVWTTSWTEPVIGYARSPDLIHWSEQRAFPVMQSTEARNAWAPELFYDRTKERYLVVWASTVPGRFPETAGSSEDDYNHRLYYATTEDFQHLSPAELLYDPGFSSIDGVIKRRPAPAEGEDPYVMFLKNERRWPEPEKNIRVATAEHPTGPYGEASAPITGDYWAEGPTAVRKGDRWRVYFDKYREDTFGVVTAGDLDGPWVERSESLDMPAGHHGTVFKVPRAVFTELLRAEEPSDS